MNTASQIRRVLAVTCLMTGSALGTAQVMEQKLVPMDGDPTDQFGLRVALTQGWALVASPLDDDLIGQSGAIYAYQRTPGGWELNQKLKASDPSFGGAMGLAIDATDTWLVATSPLDAHMGVHLSGSAHVYELVSSTWTHRQKLVASDFNSGLTEQFGDAVAIDGSVMVVGMPDDNYKNIVSGSAYVFEYQAGSWVQTAKLAPQSPSDWQVNVAFGDTVAVSGTTLVIGAPYLDVGTTPNDRGAAFVFDWNGTAWVQTQKLTSNDSIAQDFFGSAVAIDGDVILVGARGHIHNPGPSPDGAVYVFNRTGGSWAQQQEFTVSDPLSLKGFGSFVDIEDDLAVAGAGGDGDLGALSGSSYIFRLIGGTWIQIGKMLAPDGNPGDVMGVQPRIAGTTVLTGAYTDDDACGDLWQCNVGAAYVFEIAPDTKQYGFCLAVGPCGNNDDHGGCANSTSQGAVLAAGGTTSAMADSLKLEARWLPQNVLGILFMGSVTNWTPFGDGRLALGPGTTGVFRFVPPKSSGPEGALIWDGGLVARSQLLAPTAHIDPGETWYFQTWYRDPTGPCGSGFNVSNGLQVNFTP